MNRFVSEIKDRIDSFDGSRTSLQIFQDWVKLMALSIQQRVFFSSENEKEYMNLISSYKAKEQNTLCEMMGILIRAMEDRPIDYLGQIYMEATEGVKQTGSFYTSPHISELLARMTIEDNNSSIVEPSCGSGANLIAACSLMKEKGINYQEDVFIRAVDLDANAVHMAYVQLSLIGASAIVRQGNTLTDEYGKTFVTPMYLRNMAYGFKRNALK